MNRYTKCGWCGKMVRKVYREKLGDCGYFHWVCKKCYEKDKKETQTKAPEVK